MQKSYDLEEQQSSPDYNSIKADHIANLEQTIDAYSTELKSLEKELSKMSSSSAVERADVPVVFSPEIIEKYRKFEQGRIDFAYFYFCFKIK